MGGGRRNLVTRPCHPNHWESKAAHNFAWARAEGLATRQGGGSVRIGGGGGRWEEEEYAHDLTKKGKA